MAHEYNATLFVQNLTVGEDANSYYVIENPAILIEDYEPRKGDLIIIEGVGKLLVTDTLPNEIYVIGDEYRELIVWCELLGADLG